MTPMRTFAKDILPGWNGAGPKGCGVPRPRPPECRSSYKSRQMSLEVLLQQFGVASFGAVQHIVERIPQPFILQDRAVGDVEHLPGVTVIEEPGKASSVRRSGRGIRVAAADTW